MQVWEEIKRSYRSGNIAIRLVYANVAIFAVVKLLDALVGMVNPELRGIISDWLAVPAHIPTLIFHFWSVITYQFMHVDFMHLLVNMLWLYWFGQLFLRYYNRFQALSVYLWGGFMGAILYVLAFNLIPYYQGAVEVSQMLGASASILALVVATAVAAPNETIRLAFIGPVKLKYMAIAALVIDLLSVRAGNAGGHIAHIGGALAGFWFAKDYLNRNTDITIWIHKAIEFILSAFKNVTKPKPKMKARPTGGKRADMEYNKQKKAKQTNVDKILEKIKVSGYNSLTKAEKEELFKASK